MTTSDFDSRLTATRRRMAAIVEGAQLWATYCQAEDINRQPYEAWSAWCDRYDDGNPRGPMNAAARQLVEAASVAAFRIEG
jgi:hypothetical protein